MTTQQIQPPVHGAAPVTNTPATVAFVLTIFGIVGAFVPFLNFLSLILCGIGLVLAIIGLSKARHTAAGKGKSVVALILALLTFVIVPLVNSATTSALDDVATDLGTTSAELLETTVPDPPAVDTEPAAEPETPAEPQYTMEEQQAIASALDYLDYTAFSKQGLIDQLSSEYGEQFPVKVAETAVNSLDVDWSAEAVEAADDYVRYGSFSCDGLVDQLSSEYGEQFTSKQALHGAKEIGLC